MLLVLGSVGLMLLVGLRAADKLQADGGDGFAKLMPTTLLELIRSVMPPAMAGRQGAYGAPGEPGLRVDEADRQPPTDPANPFPLSVQV